MDDPQHTPGPWTIEYPMGDDQHVIVQANKPTYEWSFIATVTSDEQDGKSRIPPAQSLANARLIAAAPDLLAACKCVCGMLGTAYDLPRALSLVRAAIAKASP